MSYFVTTGARAAAALAATAVLGLTGTVAAHAAGAVGATDDAHTSPGAATGRLPECTNAQLTARYRGTDAGMSHRFGQIVFTNTSDVVCRTGGFGGLSYVGHGDGTQVGAAADRVDGTAVHSIVVKPGQHVTSEVSAAVATVYPRHTCRRTHVDGFRVYLPNETRSQYVAHPTLGCANPKVHLLSHQALS